MYATATTRAMSHGDPRSLDRLLRAAVHRVTSHGPPPPLRLLARLRREALSRTLEVARPRADRLGSRLCAGDASAREELADLAARSLVAMRREVQLRASEAGPLTSLAARADARWNDCNAEELLDDPTLDVTLRTAIMGTLDRFNESCSIYQRFFDNLLPLAREDGPTRVLDLAAGHGGFALHAAASARARGLDVQFVATDIKPEYLEMGESLARQRDLPVRFAVQDAFDLSNLAPGSYDIIVCTQSLHHFPPGSIALMFEAATRVAASGVVFVDACRSSLSATYAAFYAALRREPPAWIHDAWISTRKALVPEELELLARLGRWGDGVESRWQAPAHCLLRWRRPRP